MSYTRVSENDVLSIRVMNGQWEQSMQCEERRIVITSLSGSIKRELIIHCYSQYGEPDAEIGLIVDPEK